MKSIASSTAFCAAALVVAACLCFPVKADTVESGQRVLAQTSIEPAFDASTGSPIYLLTPLKSPFPSKSNPRAAAPLYLVTYPLSSTLPAAEFNCQPNNCDHVNVLPFPDVDYGALAGTDTACADFNGGNPCAPVKGHDHLVGVASTKGDFNVAWHVQLVIFTHAAFLDGKINTRITTLSQLEALVQSGDAFIADTPITFNCSVVSGRTYDMGTPVVIPFP